MDWSIVSSETGSYKQRGDLDARMQRVEDQIEIRDLIARYGIAVDDRDVAALSALFTSDGSFLGHALGASVGRDSVIDYFKERWKTYGPTFHYTHSSVIYFQSDFDAYGIVSGHAEIVEQSVAVRAAFRYHDRYRRTDGSWLFHERRVQFFYAMPFSEIPSHLATAKRRRWPGTEPREVDWPE